MIAQGYRIAGIDKTNLSRIIRLFFVSTLVALPAVTFQHAAATPVEPATFSESCSAERARVKARLTGLMASQASDGGLMFAGSDTLIARHPVLATIGLDMYRHDRDISFLQQVHDASARYAGHVLAQSDRDGDFVLERASWADQPGGGTIEDVGYNALFALDLLNLSRIAAELDSPVDALFWYQGTRTISRQLIQQTYDSRSRFFLPMNNYLGRRESLHFALSTMPTYFDAYLGENLSKSIMSHYLLKNQTLRPEAPYRYLDWSVAGEELSNGLSPAFALRAALLLGLLHHHAMAGDGQRFVDRITPWIDARSSAGTLYDHPENRSYVDYFSCLITGGGYQALLPQYYEMDLLATVVGLRGVIAEDELPEVQKNVSTLKRFLANGHNGAGRVTADISAVEDAMRQVYWTISSLRTGWRTRSLFTPRDRNKVPGFDIYTAFDELLEDVVITLQTVETALSTAKAAEDGLDIAVTLQNEVVVPGEPVSFRVAVRVMNRPVDITSIVLFREQRMDTLLVSKEPVRLNPGDPAREYWHQYVPTGSQGMLETMRFSAELRLARGSRLRYHFGRGVYVTNPITYSVTFPQGRILKGGNVAVEIEVTKHVDKAYVVNAEWYSPAGLNPREGRSLELRMADDTPTGLFQMNVPVPTPCRPGAFPFLVKIFGNGDDWGTLSASLFKHYQWVFVGPFPSKSDALNASYPPEQAVNLRESYSGVIRPISWSALPNRAYKETGEIDLTSLLPHESVGYLHTVIETASEKRTTVTIASWSPALVFINGQVVLRAEGPMLGSPQHAAVTLAAGMNNILIKLLSGDARTLFFQLGDEDDLTSDEFNNNLWELVDGFQEFYEKSQNQHHETDVQRVVTLTYRNTDANSVSVIGSFNGWSPVNANMREAESGRWEISLHLPPGRYAYRFLVNNSTQVLDPNASLEEPDGYGGMNSVLFVR
jgi:hypothetical protein